VTPSTKDLCVSSLIQNWAERSPEATAVAAPGRRDLTYGRLFAHIEYIVITLNNLGIGRNDRVAAVVPNGPESAVCFLSVAAGATYVPLSPAWRSTEYEAYLSDVGARILLIQSGVDSPAVAVAKSLDIPVIELTPLFDRPAGLFSLAGRSSSKVLQGGFARPEDVALVMPTSGTTSRPKIVPLRQSNICLSAAHMAAAFGLSTEDRCLNVMPLFHIHGLIGAVLSSLAAGGSVFCTPGFYAPQFFGWLKESRSTWYTAVPTMHQAIVAQSERHPESAAGHSLRFVRSCSAPLAPKVMQDLENIFGVPSLESYGMTEGSHQIASNPLPPQRRKPGSVGLPAGAEIAVVDEAWNPLPPGQPGEVVLKGATIADRYENDPEATRSAFGQGWFRTGDQGWLDDEGYLFLTGRFKELINRGGVKISPREIDEALLHHPDVAEAVAFAVPHARLGEDVAAAVVLRNGAATSERDLRQFAAYRLADFKVPRRVVVVKEIPKGPTAKTQRIGLAEKLGLAPWDDAQAEADISFVPPCTPLEHTLARIFAEVLGLTSVGVNDDFFRLGGDSMLAAQFMSRVSDAIGVDFSLIHFYETPTVAGLAGLIANAQLDKRSPALVALKRSGSRPPFFCIPPGAQLPTAFRDLAELISPDRPFYALQPYDLVRTKGKYDIDSAAAHYLEVIRSVQPEGPYLLGGHCSGSFVALEIARQLTSQGERVAFLAAINPVKPGFYERSLASHWQTLLALPLAGKVSYIFAKVRLLGEILLRKRPKLSAKRQSARASVNSAVAHAEQINQEVYELNRRAWGTHLARPYPGAIDILLAEGCLPPDMRPALDPRRHWGRVASGGLNVHIVPGNHVTILNRPQIEIIADRLRVRLKEVEQAGTPGPQD